MKCSLKRPSSKETEEELLEAQNAYLKSKELPLGNHSGVSIQEKEASNLSALEQGTEESAISLEENVVGEIQEKNIRTDNFKFSVQRKEKQSFDNNKSVPAVEPGSKEKFRGRSLFAQKKAQMRSEGYSACQFSHDSVNVNSVDQRYTSDTRPGSGVPSDDLNEAIHVENLQRISEMSQSEIYAHQKLLLEKLDPKTITFLRNRGKTKNYNSGEETKKRLSPSSQSSSNLKHEAVATEFDTDIESLVSSNFLHMNVLEREKLAWTTDIQKLNSEEKKTEEQQCVSARFDFEGNLLSRDEVVPFNMGLHHHSEEPEAAGYTLNELIPLCRSSVPGQRTLALKILGRLIEKAKLGIFDSAVKPSVLPQLFCNDSLPFSTLIRHSMDDEVEAVCVAAVHVVAVTLHSAVEEACLDRMFSWWAGIIQPFLKPPMQDEIDVIERLLIENPDQNERTDEEMCREDLIEGLLSMQLLERLRYLFEVKRPKSRQFLKDVVDILVRVGRHSSWASQKIVTCEGLLDCLISELLPCELTTQRQSDAAANFPNYGVPYWGVVKLIRVLCASDRKIANTFVSKYKLQTFLARVVATESNHSVASFLHTCQLYVESYRLWTVFICYGYYIDLFSDIFEVILKQLRCVFHVDFDKNADSRQFIWDRAAACAGLVEKVVLLHVEAVSERQMVGLMEALENSLGHIMTAFCNLANSGSSAPSDSLMDMLCAFLNCAASCDMSKKWHLSKKSDSLEKACMRFSEQFILHRLNKFGVFRESWFCNDCWKADFSRDFRGLPTLRAVTKDCGDLHICVRSGVMFPLLIAWCRYLYFSKEDLYKMKWELLQESCIGNYLSSAPASLKLAANRRVETRDKVVDWFSKQEICFLLWLTFLKKQLDEAAIPVDVVSGCLSHLHSGQEALALNMTEIIGSEIASGKNEKAFKWVMPKSHLDNSLAQNRVLGLPASFSQQNKGEKVLSLCQNRSVLLIESSSL